MQKCGKAFKKVQENGQKRLIKWENLKLQFNISFYFNKISTQKILDM